MSDEPKFSSAEIDVVLHATENKEKVLKSIENMISVPAASFSGDSSEGHFGNKIILLRATLPSQGAVALADRIMSVLNSTDRQELADHLAKYSDEKGNLYLRLDKQRICKGKVSLAESDAVRVKFKPVRRYRPSGNLQAYRGLLSLG